MAETKSEGFVSEDFIPAADGDFLRWKKGDKKGQCITLAEFIAMSVSRQTALIRFADPNVYLPAKGIKRSEETKEKMSAAHKGKTKSEETKKKISDAKKKSWESGSHKGMPNRGKMTTEVATALRKANCISICGEPSADWLERMLPEFMKDSKWVEDPREVMRAAIRPKAPELTANQISGMVGCFHRKYVKQQGKGDK